MEQITQSITLDLVGISHNVVNARLNDKLTRDLRITITNNGREYEITDDSYVYLRAKRADGKSVLFPAKILENNIVHINIPNCLLSCAGRRMLDVVIYHRVQTDDGNDSDMIASTEPFILYIPDKIFDEKEIAESDEANALAELILSANDAINEAKQAASDLQDKFTTLENNIPNIIPKATQSVDGLLTKEDKAKLDGIATGSEVNQNAFSHIAIGSDTISADSKTDTLTFAAGDNITITTEETDHKITISSDHGKISTSKDTVSTVSPGTGETFTTIDTLTRDSNGHVTKVNTKTVTLPRNSVVVDAALSSTSTNPVQNKVVNNALNKKLSLSGGTVSGSLKFNNGNSNMDGYISFSDNSLTIRAPGSSDGAGLVFKDCASGIMPYIGAINTTTMNLGTSTNKFGSIYAINTALNSDQKLKKDIESLDTELDTLYSLFDNINFVKFRWKDNNNGALETKPSCRYHYGVIAQEIEKLMHENGLTNYDNGFIHSNFFLDNTTGCYITGGYREPKDGYDYSQNVWNYKNNEEYEIYNEVIEKNLCELDHGARYKHRPEIQYILIQDISKVRAKGKQPPLTINSIHLIDKEGNSVPIHLSTEGGISCYAPEDKDFENPGSSAAINDNGSITISFCDMWSSYMIKIADDDHCYNFYDYESIIADVDFIGEYKIYLIPKGDYQTCDFWNDRDRTDEIAYDYTFNYQELTTLSLAVLQQTRKDYMQFKEVSNSKISELESKIKQLENK